MNNNLVYLAHPIDLGRANPGLIDYTIGELQAMGLPSYDPLGAFNAAGTPSGVIQRVNEAAMLAASGAVAFVPNGVQSVGVPFEISYLLSHGKPTLVVTDLGSRSWVMASISNHVFGSVVDLSEEGVSAGLEWLRSQMAYFATAPADHVEPIVFERIRPEATLPTQGYETDAGYDLYAVESVTVPARGQVSVSCGVAADIPDGLWAQITGRSSTLKKYSLMVAPTTGVIDEGYTGELFAPVVSLNNEDVKIDAGQRIAQFILHEAPGQRYRPTWGVCRTKDRGSNGFGSTGR